MPKKSPRRRISNSLAWSIHRRQPANALQTNIAFKRIASPMTSSTPVDAAIVATPSTHHFQISRDLLRSGIHLLVEKPLTIAAAEANELVETARRSGVVLQVGHVERFNPALQAAMPDMAHPQYIETVRSSPFTFRSTDIGAVLDLMVHDIDIVLSLVGSRLLRVDATGISIFGEREDVASARLEFDCGCVASLSVCARGHGIGATDECMVIDGHYDHRLRDPLGNDRPTMRSNRFATIRCRATCSP